MTTDNNTPIALSNIDKAKGLHHLHGLVTKANTDEGEDDPATSTNDPDNQATHQGNPDNNKPNEDPITAKRYFDLKAHHDKTVMELRQEIAELKKAKPAQLEIPKTPEEVAALRSKYPELVDTLISAFRMDIMKEREVWQSEREAEKQERERLKQERDAEILLKAHPDAKKISESQDFINWFNDQPTGIQNLIGSTNVRDTIKGFDLYKLDRGIKSTAVDAAQRVKTGSKTTPEAEKKIWYESEIEKLSDREWDRLEAEILQAKREGRLRPG